MARYAITIITIAAITLATSCRLSPEPTELTVLTYNTHLFKGVSVDAFMKTKIYEDETRRTHIAAEIRASGADIVGLQEVWAIPWQEWFADRLKATYPYHAMIDNTCDTSLLGIDALDDGVLLLSKWPLSDVKFDKFPAFTQCNIWEGCDAWANKGVITATVNVNGAPIRIGISHALTGEDDDKSNWVPNYIGNAITTFQLNGRPYIFALDKNNQAHIRRFEDYSYFDEASQTQKHGAGWTDVCKGDWTSDYRAVVSFELNGHPYLFSLKSGSDQAYVTRINDDPSTGWKTFDPYFWDKDYRPTTITSFQLNGQAYIFGLKSGWDQAWFYRINTDPATGELNPSVPFEEFGWKPFSRWFGAITSFESNGRPWLYCLKSNYDQVYIQRINEDPSTGKLNRDNPFTIFGPFTQAIDRHFIGETITSYQLNGRNYIFGKKSTWDQAWLYRIKADPSKGLESLGWYPWPKGDPYEGGRTRFYQAKDYIAVESFEMNGHPYLFALSGCCHDRLHLDPCMHWRPGEVFIKRIKDDGSGWENLYQLEDMKIIRDATAVEDGPPAIMMGDFNIHRSKYGIMDQLFRKAGAMDAYVEVHGTGEGGETVDWFKNRLAKEHFWLDEDPADPDLVDRIDYVYVKQSGAGLKLIPTEAYVMRDWKYGDDNMDLSDHYPLVVKFRLEAQ
jgi:endonuclease/exonuclease/phosphatase family metal-dependent hydrolase